MRVSHFPVCSALSTLSLVLGAAACGSEASCPSGTVKNSKDACVATSAVDANPKEDAGSNRADRDAAVEQDDASVEVESDACVAGREVCNGADDDCDGDVDEGVVGDSFEDRDRDGYGTGAVIAGCGGLGYASRNGDCDDANAMRSPGAAEVCNGSDDNCNGTVDEGVQATLYRDEDGDGHGLASHSDTFCAGQAAPGWVPGNQDCDDKCPTCSPSNTQETLCDGKDDDCDSKIDDGVDQLFEADCDRDGFAVSGALLQRACARPGVGPAACAQGTWIAPGGVRDCNDARSDVHPGAPEVCDYVDNDCDSAKDEGEDGVSFSSRTVWILDCDGDSYILAEPDPGQIRCPNDPPEVPAPCVPLGGAWRTPAERSPGVDCADGDANAYPGSTYISRDPIAGESSTTSSFDYNCKSGDELANGSLCASGPAGQLCLGPSSCWPTAPQCGTASNHSFCVANLNGTYIRVTRAEAPLCH